MFQWPSSVLNIFVFGELTFYIELNGSISSYFSLFFDSPNLFISLVRFVLGFVLCSSDVAFFVVLYYSHFRPCLFLFSSSFSAPAFSPEFSCFSNFPVFMSSAVDSSNFSVSAQCRLPFVPIQLSTFISLGSKLLPHKLCANQLQLSASSFVLSNFSWRADVVLYVCFIIRSRNRPTKTHNFSSKNHLDFFM